MKIEDHACRVCGAFGPYGLGPPASARQEWLCTLHWRRTKDGQHMIARRQIELAEDPEIDLAFTRR